ncbi:hypothetical protein NP233_g11880 [Leucocoprinus birnbaumii]|uniref:Uncharacterized protein n=1 Tax=Leucocoprinus birnbaumii TaxID=56174 RepID=A0AAD5VLD4_9AGAR|nr:hypothetical protein NP233_g11880 [Leucocoprinus birnbaumii]
MLKIKHANQFWSSIIAFIVIFLCDTTLCHIAAWTKGTYCLNGTTPGVDDENTHLIVDPLYQLNFSDWWMHHVDNCDQFPPDPGDFLEIPALGAFTVEHAANRAFTTLSYNGTNIATYPDGQDHPGLENSQECIQQPNIHTQNESMAAGSAFAISYTSNLSEVNPTNLVVFSVLYNTPWRRLATYTAPRLPPCPDGGCICAVPNGCGTPNMYMHPLKCNVTGQTGNLSLAQPEPPVWCEGNVSACTSGPKQMIYWNQLEGNNIAVSGQDLSGAPKSPGYNMNCGFADGPQNDIFIQNDTGGPTPPPDLSAAPKSRHHDGRVIALVYVLATVLLSLGVT